MNTARPTAQIASARPEMTAVIVTATGLDESLLREMVQAFYAKVRSDAVLGPTFDAHITDWTPHLERMITFWSSVALMTGRYHGRPQEAHTKLAVGALHFERWLALFKETAQETCSTAGAAHLITRAERIARSLLSAVEESQTVPKPLSDGADQRTPP